MVTVFARGVLLIVVLVAMWEVLVSLDERNQAWERRQSERCQGGVEMSVVVPPGPGLYCVLASQPEGGFCMAVAP
jgi:hypothetical protein